MLGTQITPIQGFPAFTYDMEIWGTNLKNSHWKVFQEEHEETYDISCQSVFFDNLSYYIG